MNTMAGSMRMTCAMAKMAEKTHMATVSRNRAAVRFGVMNTGSAVSAVACTMIMPIPAAMQNPMIALNTAWMMMTA